jgi:cbb3-type cytochrome oxidase subunit 3
MKSILVLLLAAFFVGSLAPLYADGGKSGDDQADRKKKERSSH